MTIKLQVQGVGEKEIKRARGRRQKGGVLDLRRLGQRAREEVENEENEKDEEGEEGRPVVSF